MKENILNENYVINSWLIKKTVKQWKMQIDRTGVDGLIKSTTRKN